ncbi:AvrPphF family type III effector [Escherichia coli :H19]|uniref:AvrPphF family type III effector n=1 Tax=Escherichia coli TaxID=562 RepID=UPI00207B5F2E|nr:AvrPphF family type III effector [Escherichia coli]
MLKCCIYNPADFSIQSKKIVSGYRKSPADIIISFQMKDVLNCGGRIYRDASSSFENVIIIGLPKGKLYPIQSNLNN